MPDEPRHRSRRRTPIQVEPLEGRALLSAVRASTPVSTVRHRPTVPLQLARSGCPLHQHGRRPRHKCKRSWSSTLRVCM